jgi:tRNA(adenine34) deaminase
MNEHQQFMERCFALAKEAAAEGESAVGSIVVKDGVVIGEGYEKSRQLKDITRHAEIVAILDAVKNGGDLAGTVLYSNVEPCILCSYAIRHYKIGEVVYASPSGELGGTMAPFNVLTTTALHSWGHPPKVTVL